MVWVLYDIANDRIRYNVAKACKGAGIYRVQKSAFLGRLNRNEIDELALKTMDLVDLEKDSLYIFPMCDEDFKKAKLIGRAFDKGLVSDDIIAQFF